MTVLRQLAFGFGIVVLLIPCTGVAQQSQANRPEAKRPVPDSLFRLGRRAWAKRDTQRAVQYLERAFARRPSLRLSSGESVSFLLGRIYQLQGAMRRAVKTWKDGLVAQRSSSVPVDLRMADAILQGLPNVGFDDRYEHGCLAYRTILKHVGTEPQPPADTIVRRHVAQLIPILSESKLRSIVEGTSDRPIGTWQFDPDAGEHLLRWWRRHDSLPATKRNERMMEHLQRVTHARRHFGCSSAECQPKGWDERGTVYVRFGAPSQRDSITYNDPDFNQEIIQAGVSISRHAFPDNELWTYSHISDFGQYIFVEEDGYYKVATASSLLPRKLRIGYGGKSERMLNKAMFALAALRHIYRQLSMHHVRYGNRYNRIASYASWQKEQAYLVEMGVLPSSRTRQVGDGVGQTESVGPGPGATNATYPNDFVLNHFRKSKVVDKRAAQRRDEEMPTEYDSQSDEQTLPVAVRTARFLTETGSTEVRIAWGHPPGTLSLSERARRRLNSKENKTIVRHQIRLSAVQYGTAFHRQKTSSYRYSLQQKTVNQTGSSAIQTLTARARTDSFHIRLQWDHRVVFPQRVDQMRQAPLVSRAQRRLDSLTALKAENEGLIMSDVMPGRLQEGAPPLRENITPYPFSTLDDKKQITLYFELYRLARDERGQTRYTITYRVEGAKEEDGWLGGLLGGEESTETQTRVTYQGEKKHTQEMTTLNLEKWKTDQGESLRVTVRVMDEISGENAKRTVTFSKN